jgi:hypothetical protein
MKKIQMLLMLLCCFVVSQAQPGKPTKEQTVKYLNTLAQASIGKNNGDGSINLIVFSYTSVEIGTTNGSKHTWSNIPWQEFDSLRVLQNDKIILSFKIAMPTNYSDPKGEFESNEPEDSFFFIRLCRQNRKF